MMHSVVAKIKRMAGTFRQEREGILNWWKKGSTNSFLEGLNSLVQSARSTASGFRSIAYNKTIIFLRLGNSTSRSRVSLHALSTRDVKEPNKPCCLKAARPRNNTVRAASLQVCCPTYLTSS